MRKYSLYTLVVVIFLILVISRLVTVYFSITQHRKDLINTAIEEKIHLAEIINEILASPVWIYELVSAPGLEKIFILEMAKFKDVEYIRVVSGDGTIYKSSIEAEWGKTIEDPDISTVLRTGETIIKDQIIKNKATKLIIYPGYQDKTIWIAFSLEGVKKTIQGMLIRDLLVTFEGLLAFILILFFVILRGVINPLKKMEKVCQQVREGNLDVKMTIPYQKEIGELAATFNKTVADLKKSETVLEEERISLEIKVRARARALEEERASLEKKVEQRTKELQDRIEELERFHKITVGRELKMIGLKKEIERLKKQILKIYLQKHEKRKRK